MKTLVTLSISAMALLITSCANGQNDSTVAVTLDTAQHNDARLNLPAPYATKSVKNFSKVIGWPEGKMPIAPQGFVVNKFAEDLKSCRWIYVLPNGDVLVSQASTERGTKSSPDQVTLLRDANKDGVAEIKQVFLTGIPQPFGMLLVGSTLYVAGTSGLWKFPYKTGDTRITVQGTKIMDLPEGGYNNHWTRNIITNQSKTKIYVSVGSGSNVAEHGMENEKRRANILEINLDGSGERVYASGLRNPVGMALLPGTDILWTAVNERDELGNELVPDYMTSVQDGGFYGWPYSYYGQNVDPRIDEKDQRKDLVSRAIVPDVPLDSHTASLGLAFYSGTSFPAKYSGGAFVGQHGSWNRKDLAGYRVAFVPFKLGMPSGAPEDFLSGFIADKDKSEVYGRPVGVTILPDGSMLVADDGANIIWRVSYKK